MNDPKPHWAPKVPRATIQQLYELDAQGITDAERIDEVGWALWQRCESILVVTAAHAGHVPCPNCDMIIERENPRSEEGDLVCPRCGWRMPWIAYHQSYRSRQLFGANAVTCFQAYHDDFPKAQTAQQKMVLIDQLIHAFHLGLKEVGRPAAANLLEGKLGEVIHFLDKLSSDPASAAGLSDSRPAWRRTLAQADWSIHFLSDEANDETSQN